MGRDNIVSLLDKLNSAISLSYWEHENKGIFLFDSGVCAHIKMSRKTFNEIESKYYKNKLKNVVVDSEIRNKQSRKKRVNWEGFEELYYHGYDYKDIAKIIGCGIASVVRKVSEDICLGALKPRIGGIFSDSRKIELLKEMKKQNKTPEEISKCFNCHKNTITKAIRTLKDRKEL
ncbi:hypothetical protein [Cetobacterium sp.]